jgi:antirestriction protein ArdC
MAGNDNKQPFYVAIAEQLIRQLEAGTAPLQKPWEPGVGRMPHNPVSVTRYKGGNSLWLAMQMRSDPRWMTYKQAQSIGAQVQRGEKGTLVQYWKFRDKVPKKDANGKVILDSKGKKVMVEVKLDKPRVFSAVVFNAEQIKGLPSLVKQDPPWDRHQRAEALLAKSGAEIHHDQTDRAFYRLSTDAIHLPGRGHFETADRYYATALHELGHWTGHPERLNRDLSGGFGSASYAKEELRAEIASLMLGDELGIGHDPGQHAAYVQHWVAFLKEEPKEILRAARDAENIMARVLGQEREKTLGEPTQALPVEQTKAVLAQERREAATMIASQLGNTARTYPARDKGIHQGPIIGQTQHYVIQRTAPKVAILHNRAHIEGNIQTKSPLKVQYRDGRATVEPVFQEKREQGLAR